MPCFYQPPFHPMIRTLLLTLIFGTLLSCGQRDISRRLDLAESLLETHPDSALTLISSIDISTLHKDADRARFALIKSVALDKNYIDVDSFSILQPAIDYYLKEGSPEEKLRTYYYQGRIYQNMNDNDNAMKSFIYALDVSAQCDDTLLIARTLVAQSVIFLSVFQIESFIDNNIKAASLYAKKENNAYEFDCLLRALNGSIIENNQILSDSLISRCETIAKNDSSLQKSLTPRILSYWVKFGSNKKIAEILELMDKMELDDFDFMIDKAKGYAAIGNPKRASEILDSIKISENIGSQARFYAIASEIYELKNDYKSALIAYHQFDSIESPIVKQMFDQDIQFSEEKHKLELYNLKESSRKRIFINYGIISLCFISIILLIIYYRYRVTKKEKEKIALENDNLRLEKRNKSLEAENLTHRIEHLESERSYLKELLDNQQELSEPIEKAIKERMEILNTLIAGYISDNDQFDKAYEKWVNNITENQDVFMNNTRLSLSASHPRFIEYLTNKGLSIDEINHVCLYAIGLRGKEVGKYINRKDYYNVSSNIRKKLGIGEHNTNLGIYVRKLLKSL